MKASIGHPHCGPDKAPQGPSSTHHPPDHCGPTSWPRFLEGSRQSFMVARSARGAEDPRERWVTEVLCL